MSIADYILKIIEILVPAFVALVVGGVTAWISVRQIRQATVAGEKQIKASLEASMLQYRAQVLSANRQEWINSVRDVTAEYISLAGTYGLEWIQASNKKGTSPIAENKNVLFLRSKLRLLLNPNEKAAQDVLSAMKEFGEWFSIKNPDWDDFAARRSKFEAAVGGLLKSEWERVKRGE